MICDNEQPESIYHTSYYALPSNTSTKLIVRTIKSPLTASVMSLGMLGSGRLEYTTVLWNWDYIAMSYLTKLCMGTIVNVLQSIWHVFRHPGVPLGPPWPISGGLGYSAVFIQLGLHCNVIFNQIHCSDCHKCFWQHLRCLQDAEVHPKPPRPIWGDLNILQYLFNGDYIDMK